jgi:hypothetical protein
LLLDESAELEIDLRERGVLDDMHLDRLPGFGLLWILSSGHGRLSANAARVNRSSVERHRP